MFGLYNPTYDAPPFDSPYDFPPVDSPFDSPPSPITTGGKGITIPFFAVVLFKIFIIMGWSTITFSTL
jgi:hypothetical protein